MVCSEIVAGASSISYPSSVSQIDLKRAAEKSDWFKSMSSHWVNENNIFPPDTSEFACKSFTRFLNAPSLKDGIEGLLQDTPSHEQLWELVDLFDYFQVDPTAIAKLYDTLAQIDNEVVLSYHDNRTVLTLGLEGAKVFLQASKENNSQCVSDDLRMNKIQYWLQHDMTEIRLKKILKENGDAILETFPCLDNLVKLDLELVRVDAKKLVSALSNVSNLTDLRIQDAYKIEGVHLKPMLKALEKLKSLALQNCKSICDIPTPDADLSVESLSLEGTCKIQDKDLIALTNRCPKLRKLNINECPKITLVGLQTICAAHPGLQEISTRGCINLNQQLTPELRMLTLST